MWHILILFLVLLLESVFATLATELKRIKRKHASLMHLFGIQRKTYTFWTLHWLERKCHIDCENLDNKPVILIYWHHNDRFLDKYSHQLSTQPHVCMSEHPHNVHFLLGEFGTYLPFLGSLKIWLVYKMTSLSFWRALLTFRLSCWRWELKTKGAF